MVSWLSSSGLPGACRLVFSSDTSPIVLKWWISLIEGYSVTLISSKLGLEGLEGRSILA